MINKIKRLFQNKKISARAIITLKRFPLTVLALLISTLIFVWIINDFPFFEKLFISNQDKASALSNFLVRLSLVTALAAFVLTAVKIFIENQTFPAWKKLSLFALAIGFLTGFFFWLPPELSKIHSIQIHQIFFLSLVSIIAFLSAPFIKAKKAGFWRFSQLMMKNFAFSMLVGAILFAGLGLSLKTINHLFNLGLKEEAYLTLWAILAAGIIPFFFLTLLPRDWQALRTQQIKSRLIKNFSYFILLPLLAIYLIILYIYGTEIIITHDWPKGIVALMILSYATAGTCIMMIIHPFRAKNRLFKNAFLIFYLTLIPLIGLLAASLHKRVVAYGWTPLRVLAGVLAIWFFLLAIYFLLSKRKGLHQIYFSLIVILLFVNFAPVNIFTISADDQFKRLENLLIEKKILVDRKIADQKIIVTEEEHDQIKDSLRLLHRVDQLERVSPWFENKSAFDYGTSQWKAANLLMRDLYLKVEKEECEDSFDKFDKQDCNLYEPFNDRGIFYQDNYKESPAYSLSGKSFDLIVNNLDSEEIADEEEILRERAYEKFYLFHTERKLLIKEIVSGEFKTIAEKDLSELIDRLWDKRSDEIRPQDMVVEVDSEQYQITIIIDDFTVKNKKDPQDRFITSTETIMLVKNK